MWTLNTTLKLFSTTTAVTIITERKGRLQTLEEFSVFTNATSIYTQFRNCKTNAADGVFSIPASSIGGLQIFRTTTERTINSVAHICIL
jgi:hypothetical protein